MWGMITGQLRRQSVRTLTLLVGVLVATAGFTLLTGSVETSRLTVKASADANFRAAYDILVRPAGARTGREESAGQVRPNFLSGQFGGITPGQWREIAGLRGVEIAAPVAMLGYVQAGTHARVDVTGQLDPAADRQLLRLRNTWTTDRSLSKARDPGSVYVYVTSNPVVLPDATSTARDPSWRSLYTYRGRHLTEVGDALSQGDSPCDDGEMPPLEVLPGGKFEPLCAIRTVSSYGGGAVNDQLDPAQRSELVVVRRHADGTFTSGTDVHNRTTSRRAVVDIDWSMTLLLAAVDPEQEARLVGVDGAMASGRYLKEGEKPAVDTRGGSRFEDIPLIVTDRPYLDEQLSTSVSRVTGTLPKLSGRGGKELRGLLAGLPVSPGPTTRADADTVFRRSVADGTIDVNPFVVLQAGAPRYAAGGGVLRPAPVASDSGELWRQSTYGGDLPAWFVQDTAFRPVTRLPGTDASQDHFPQFSVVGTYAVERLKGFSKLSEVPLETYRPPAARAADEAGRAALGGRALVPNSNPGGYLATPPQLLTTLQSVQAVTGPYSPHAKDPISAVRVRVAGVHGTDKASRERIRAVAEAITTRTGLDVDITAGSSPAPQQVALGKGKFGRPALALTENWTAKGTAVALVEAADRKSVLLFGLVLGVCALFLGNAVAASVRTRQRELAVLACTGWTGARLAGLVLGEVALVAAVAGAAGAGASFPLGWVFGLDVTAGRALFAIPLVVATALLAGALPAIRAGRPYPAQALRGSVAGPRRARRAGRGRTLPGLAVSGALRTPSRSVLGALALAVGVAAVSLVTAVMWTFQGAVQGTLLGEAVSLEVRGVDVAAAVLTAALGVFALADVLYLDSCERDGEFAMLRACGWADTEVMRLVVVQGAVIAVAGAVTGAATGLALTVAFTGSIPAGLPVAVGVVAVAGVLAAVAGSVVAAGLAVRRSPAGPLAEEG
ncbi:FtsX-like permease family protein [Streptomyces afghaniensis]|uniref:FtsX-like permease family protein n=1 Tax=Streptomyces afghaniensis TaxID=66865 RepID=UPI0037A12EC1